MESFTGLCMFDRASLSLPATLLSVKEQGQADCGIPSFCVVASFSTSIWPGTNIDNIHGQADVVMTISDDANDHG